MVLNTRVHRRRLVGALTAPEHYSEDSDYTFSGISLPVLTRPVFGTLKGSGVEVIIGQKPDRWRMPMTLADNNHLLLDLFLGQVPAFRFERVPAEPKIMATTDWPKNNYDPEVVALRQQLRTMAEQDKAAREKKLIDPQETETLSEQAKPLLESIYARYEWPRISVFGPRASDDFWLLVQHQPLALQERMLGALKEAVAAGEAFRRNYAYLFDRVQVSEGQSQHWGTQSKCEGKRAVLYPIDDMAHVEERRREIGLNNLADSVRGSNEICARVPD